MKVANEWLRIKTISSLNRQFFLAFTLLATTCRRGPARGQCIASCTTYARWWVALLYGLVSWPAAITCHMTPTVPLTETTVTTLLQMTGEEQAATVSAR